MQSIHFYLIFQSHVIHCAAYVCISVPSEWFPNNEKDLSFWYLFLWNNSVFTPWLRSGFVGFNSASIFSTHSAFFRLLWASLYMVLFMHLLCSVGLLDCIRVFSHTPRPKSCSSSADLFVQWLAQDQGYHFRIYCTTPATKIMATQCWIEQYQYFQH